MFFFDGDGFFHEIVLTVLIGFFFEVVDVLISDECNVFVDECHAPKHSVVSKVFQTLQVPDGFAFIELFLQVRNVDRLSEDNFVEEEAEAGAHFVVLSPGEGEGKQFADEL